MVSKSEKVFQGSGVSPGVVLGQALKMDSHHRLILKLHADDVNVETRRFLKAVEASKEQLEALKSRLEEKVGREHSVILDAHRLILEDRVLKNEILEIIRSNHTNAEYAVSRATDQLVDAYMSLEDEYFRDRHSDIKHVAERILLNLSGGHAISWEQLPEDLIIVARDFNPSNFATMDLKKVRGLALESGGRTSHTAIISRGLQLPAVMGIDGFLSSVATGDSLLLNGDEGQVVVNPTAERIEGMRRQMESFGAMVDSAVLPADRQTITKDGTLVSLRANTELLHELASAKKSGADGIGLFRSEFLYFSHPHGIPNVEEQLAVYRRLAREMNPYPVAIRTLDAGSEKMHNSPDLESRGNPSMGLRGIRLSLNLREAFRAQIEAILRASCDGNIEIVFPMVTTIEEIWQARALIEEVRSELIQSTGKDLNRIPVGAMIEVPAAVLSLRLLAKETDFLCVGTNDLIQYMLAVDRGNPQVAYLFQPLHPSVLSCLSHISEVAREQNKAVRICGEISSNPFFAVLLLGMGFTQLSMNPLSIPTIRKVIREIPIEASQQIAKEAMTFTTAQEVHKYLVQAVSELISFDIASFANEIVVNNQPS